MSTFEFLSAAEGQPGALLDFYTQYAAASAAAQQLAKTRANPQATRSAHAPLAASSGPRTITLVWDTPPTLAGKVPQLSGPQAGATDSIPTIAVVTAKNRHVLTFDVMMAPHVDGFAQRIEYTSSARQNIKQTVVGFHINEFGMAPGRALIDAQVVLRNTPAQQVQKLFDFFRYQKMTQPLDVTKPGVVLRLYDSYLGRAYIISQESLRFSESAEVQNQGRLTVSAAILRDYSNPVSANAFKQATGATAIASLQQQATNDLSALQQFVDAAGGSLG